MSEILGPLQARTCKSKPKARPKRGLPWNRVITDQGPGAHPLPERTDAPDKAAQRQYALKYAVGTDGDVQRLGDRSPQAAL